MRSKNEKFWWGLLVINMDILKNETLVNTNNNVNNSQEAKQLEEDAKNAQEFDIVKKDGCVELFLSRYPDAKDYEIADFVNRARRSYVRAKRKELSDEAWNERLRKHIAAFKFVAPLQRELEKLIINQKMVSMEIERAKLAKEKAKLEKEKIDFLNEQLKLAKTGKSSYYRHLTTISQLEMAKRQLEDNYKHEIEKIKDDQLKGIKNAVGTEVRRVKTHYDQRFLKLSQFYEIFKQKYQSLRDINAKTQFDLNVKQQEIYNLKLQLNHLVDELRMRDERIEVALKEVDQKSKELEKVQENQPKIIEENVEREVQERMRSQINKLNSVLLDKEKTLLQEIHNRRSEIEGILAQKEKEYNDMVNNVSEMERLIRLGNDEINRIKKDYNVVVYTNRELNEAVKDLTERNEQLNKEKTFIESEKADLNKLNNLLVKKYHDSEYLQKLSEQINLDIRKIAEQQQDLGDLLKDKTASTNETNTVFNRVNDAISTLNNKLGLVSDSANGMNLVDPNDKLFPRSDDDEIISYTKDINPKTKKQSSNKLKTKIIASRKANESKKVKPKAIEKVEEEPKENRKKSLLVDKLINIE